MIARHGCFGEAIFVACFSAWYTWDTNYFCELLWSCAAELASPCENARYRLVALPNVLCALVILSSLAMFVRKNTSRPWFSPSHFKISYGMLQQPCAVRAVGVFFAVLPTWLSTIIPMPFQPRHSAKSCTIFASRSFRILQKLWWACVASKKQGGHFPDKKQACETMKWSTMIYKLNWRDLKRPDRYILKRCS